MKVEGESCVSHNVLLLPRRHIKNVAEEGGEAAIGDRGLVSRIDAIRQEAEQ